MVFLLLCTLQTHLLKTEVRSCRFSAQNLLMIPFFHQSKSVLSKGYKTHKIWLPIPSLTWLPTFLHFHHNLLPIHLCLALLEHSGPTLALEPCTNCSLCLKSPHTPSTHTGTHSFFISSLNSNLSFSTKLTMTTLFNGATSITPFPPTLLFLFFCRVSVSSSKIPDGLLANDVDFFLSYSLHLPALPLNLRSFERRNFCFFSLMNP